MSYNNLDLDLDIHNYNFDDMLRIFKINDDDFFVKFKDLSYDIDTILNKVKVNFNNEYYIFYLKVFQILNIIHILCSIDKSNINICNTLCNNIKSIKDFETKTNEFIIDHLNNINVFGRPIIQQEKTNTVVSTTNNNVSPGLLNSIKRVTQKTNYYLNSIFRQNYNTTSSTNFYYDLPTEVKNVVSLSLTSIELPNSWYTITSKNNTFQIVTTNGSIKKTWPITIEEGNYTSDTLQSYLNNNFFFMSPTYAGTDLANIKFLVDENNAKTSFEVVIPSTGFSFDIVFDSTTNDFICPSQKNILSIAWILGFRQFKYTKITSKIVSEALLDCAGDRYIYFSLNDFQYNKNSNNIICFKESIADNNILAKIPLSFGKFSVIIDNSCGSLSKTRIFNGPVTIKRIQVILYDKYGNIIDLNHMDFSFTLEFEILYEGFNFENIN